MTVIYKREDRNKRFEIEKVKAQTRGTRKNIIIGRCLTCNLLFETSRIYRRRTCWLCKFDKNSSMKEGCLKKWNKTYKDLEEHLFKRHKEIQIIKDRRMEAGNCKVINSPICKRLLNK